MDQRRTLLLSSAAVFAVAAAVLTYVYATTPGDPFAPCRESDMLDFAQIGGPFTLTDETGQSIDDQRLVDQPTLLYMGYTFCPDVCPLDNMRNAEAIYTLEEKGVAAQAVFVSVDPQRDTPQVLADFTDVFHPQMIGLTGDKASLVQMAKDYHAVFEFHNEEDEFYLVDHSTFTYLMMPGHGVVDIFSRDDTADVIAERMSCVAEKA